MIGTLLWALISGLVLGVLARMILPGKQQIPLWATVLAGAAAAFIGGEAADLMGVGDTRGIDWIRHILQVLLAVGAVAATAAFFSRRTPAGQRAE